VLRPLRPWPEPEQGAAELALASMTQEGPLRSWRQQAVRRARQSWLWSAQREVTSLAVPPLGWAQALSARPAGSAAQPRSNPEQEQQALVEVVPA